MGERTARAASTRPWATTLAGGGALVLVAVVLQNVGNFAFHAVSARIVGPETYGALGTLLTLTVAFTIPLAALQTAVTRSVAEAGRLADPNRFLRRATLGAAGLAVALAAAAPLVDGFLKLGSVSAAALLGPYVATAALAAVTRGVAVGRTRFALAAASIVGAVVVRIGAGIVLTTWFGIEGAMLATFAAEAVGVAVAWRAARTADSTPPLHVAWTAMADTLAMTLGVWMLGSIDVLVAGHVLGGRERAVYVAAGTAARAILVLPQAVVMVAMPRFVAALRDEDGATAPWPALRDAMGLALALTAVGVAGVALVGGRLLTATFGAGFADGGTVLLYCALATVPVALASMLATFHLAAHSRASLLPWIGVGAEVVSTTIWHGSAVQLAQAALAGVTVQLAVTAVAVIRERRRAAHAATPDPSIAAEPARAPGAPVRILVLAWRDLAHPAAGGSEVYVESMARRWAAAGHTVTLCCAAVAGRPADEMVEGVRVVRAGNRFSVYRHARAFVARARDVDVIIECVNTKPFDAPRVAGTTPVVALIHQVAREVWWYEAPLPAAVLGRFVLEPRWLRRYRDVPTLTISASSRESLLAYGLRDVTVLPVGIDPPDPAVPSEKAPVPTLAFCGRLVRSKRPDHAVEAFRRLRAQMPEARLVLIGSGPMSKRLARQAPPGVTLAGRCSAAERQRLVAAAHALLVTSVREGWGLVVSEAAAVGTPTAGYDVSGLRDSIAAAGGVATTPDPAALASALAHVLPRWVEHPPAPLPFGGAASWDETADAALHALSLAAGHTPAAAPQPAAAPSAPVPRPTLEGVPA